MPAKYVSFWLPKVTTDEQWDFALRHARAASGNPTLARTDARLEKPEADRDGWVIYFNG